MALPRGCHLPGDFPIVAQPSYGASLTSGEAPASEFLHLFPLAALHRLLMFSFVTWIPSVPVQSVHLAPVPEPAH